MTLISWLSSSLVRHYPATPAQPAHPLMLEGARNAQLSFQVAMRRDEGQRPLHVSVAVDGPDDWMLRIRRVGYVPVRHHNTPVDEDSEGVGMIPGYVPDPLFDTDSIELPAGETHAFWITLQPDADAAPGMHSLSVRICAEGGEVITHEVSVRLYDAILLPRRDFHITHWFYVDSLIDWYRTALFDERLWAILPAYMQDVVSHGQDTLYVPVFTPPLDGIKRPTQLLRVTRTAPERYVFDWTDVKRYTDLARRSGVTAFEWCHFFTQWGAKHALRIYEGQGEDERLLWPAETEALSPTYRAFLTQYLPQLHRFLTEERLLERSFFHVSDEPHADHLPQYQADRALLRELAPWIRVMDALSDIAFARQSLMDMPIPSISTALDFVAEGIPCWCYYCCGPRGLFLNRLLDTRLSKIAMHGVLFYRWPFQGFLHWGYNYWYRSQTRQLINPYAEQDALAWERGWAYGDPFLVYPGESGPVDSMRWEVFAESLQDYRLLQTLGLSREDPLLAPVASFAEFPKDEGWLRETRRQLLSRAAS